MCGIACLLSSGGNDIQQLQEKSSDANNSSQTRVDTIWRNVLSDIHRRGPDNMKVINISNRFYLAASVLHIQGEELASQPATDMYGNMLLWNGEVFRGIEQDRQTGECDTTVVLRLITDSLISINSSSSAINSQAQIASAVASVLSTIEGPYAFIYFHATHNVILYGRDPVGRRSLITISTSQVEVSSGDSAHPYRPLIVTSVCSTDLEQSTEVETNAMDSCRNQSVIIREVPVGGIYLVDMSVNCTQPPFYCPHICNKPNTLTPCQEFANFESAGDVFLQTLIDLMRRRLHTIAAPQESTSSEISSGDNRGISTNRNWTVGVLFSGGIDSVLLVSATKPQLKIDGNN